MMTSPPSPQTRLLLCLDFDLTLTMTHLFQSTVRAIQGGYSREAALLFTLNQLKRQGPRGGERLWEVLFEWLEAGHGLAITSFTSFPELPSALLSWGVPRLRALGATRDQTRWLSRALIVFGDPAPQFNPARLQPNMILIPAEKISSTQSTQPSTSSVGKNLHLNAAKEFFEGRGDHFDQVVLVDDDPNNIQAAQEGGYLAILASREHEDLSHLTAIMKLLHSK